MRKTTSNPKYTFTKRGIYYYSRLVPSDLRHHYRTARLVQSLKTRSTREACKLSRLLTQRLEAYWQNIRIDKQEIPCEFLLKDSVHQVKLTDAMMLYFELRGNNKSELFFVSSRRHVDYLIEATGDYPIKHYTTADATRYRKWLQGRGLANASVRKAIACIRAILNLAIGELGLALQNPFANIYLPSASEDRKKRRPISVDDIRLIQTACMEINDDLRWLVALISDTGMRLAEAAGLMQSDVCLDEKIPHIVIKPHPHRSLKTKCSERIIPLVDAALWAAKQIKRNATGAYCFPRYSNEMGCNANSASAALNKWIKSRTKKDYVIHGFRHSFRDRLRAVDAQSEMIDQLGGWSLQTIGQQYGTGHNLERMHQTMCKISINSAD